MVEQKVAGRALEWAAERVLDSAKWRAVEKVVCLATA